MFVFQILITYICVTGAISVLFLKYFETLPSIGVSTRIKRSHGTNEMLKLVKFKAFNRQFVLLLKPGTEVLAKGFVAKLVAQDGQMSTFYIDQSKLFSGHLLGKTDIRVTAHMEDMYLSINIFDENDTYTIEPARNILRPSENPENHTFVAYCSSDISDFPGQCANDPEEMMNETTSPHMESKCFNLSANDREEMMNETTSPHMETLITVDELKRNKRHLLGDTCAMNLVADFDFFNNRCQRHYLMCSTLMISFAQNVNMIFRRSPFRDSSNNIYNSVGIQIGMLVVYTTYTYTANERMKHFNAKDVKWTPHSKLRSFSYYMSYTKEKYCLSHLLTSYPMANHTRGYSFHKQICQISAKGTITKNTGFTSDVDEVMGQLPSQQVNIIMAHEIGHNFGSLHDPETPECSPTESEGGNYLMWGGVITGKQHNNKRFSPCSLRSIGDTLKEMASCFVPIHSVIPLCGNGIVELGEECDAGAIGIVDGDLCCSKFCKFHNNAVCSDLNVECCANCHLASYTTVCHNYGGTDCKKKSYCTGQSFHCPDPKDVENYLPCLDGRLCYGGECLSLCEVYSVERNLTLKPCMCHASDEDACKWCCYDNSDPLHPGKCVPLSDEKLKDGRPCYYGFCEEGICKRTNMTDFFPMHLLKKAFHGGLAEFFRRNIVLTVCLFNLIVILPTAVIFFFLERLKTCEHKEVVEHATQTFPLQQQKKFTNNKFISKKPTIPVAAKPPPQAPQVPVLIITPPDDTLPHDGLSTQSGKESLERKATADVNSQKDTGSLYSFQSQALSVESSQSDPQHMKDSKFSRGTFESIESLLRILVVPSKKRASFSSSANSSEVKSLSKEKELSMASRASESSSKDTKTSRKSRTFPKVSFFFGNTATVASQTDFSSGTQSDTNDYGTYV